VLDLESPDADGVALLKHEGEGKVDEVVRAMKADPKLRATADGYTDSIGTEAYNQRLSERRTSTVRNYMVSHGFLMRMPPVTMARAARPGRISAEATTPALR
jgi:flagellar motor protein MotB